MRALTLPLLGLLLSPSLARAATDVPRQVRCTGTLSGSVKGTFGCVAEIVKGDGGKLMFVLRPEDTIDGVPTYQPGSFELPGPPAARRYTLDALGMGMASVAAEGGALYTATKTSSQRGEVTLTFTAAKAPRGTGGWTVHGTYRARLIPAGAGKQGEVIVEARF